VTQDLDVKEDSGRVVDNFERRLAAVGGRLGHCIRQVLSAVPDAPQGPAQVARKLGIDKVLASRVLKATQRHDPIAVLHLSPGPAPLRRLVSAARKRGVPATLTDAARAVIDEFDAIVRNDIGDRRSLDTIISAWLPEARQEFELRRKQAASRAMSELLGAVANVDLGTVLLHPSGTDGMLDVVWLFGLLRLRRLRAGSRVKFASRRLGNGSPPRQPRTLDGAQMQNFNELRLDEFCSKPPAELDVQRAGEVVHYTLAGSSYGPQSATDLVFAEVNLAEMPHYVDPRRRPRRQVFAEVATPASTLVFDALVHESVFTWTEPVLSIYDTVLDGVADANDPARDMDRLDLREAIQPLGRGISKFRLMEFSRYVELLRHVCEKLGWDGDGFRGYRCRIDYPIYGSQVVMTWSSRDKPA
jgi:hypothetical protein